MSVLLAFAHITGTLITFAVLAMVWSSFYARNEERTKKAIFEQAAMSLGIRTEDIKHPENWPHVLHRLADRYSSDKFQNRLSDVCGSAMMAFGWLVVVPAFLILAFVVWRSFSEGPSAAVYAWWALAILIAGWLIDIVASSVCWLLTGRTPGRARAVRRFVASEMGSAVDTRITPHSG